MKFELHFQKLKSITIEFLFIEDLNVNQRNSYVNIRDNVFNNTGLKATWFE